MREIKFRYVFRRKEDGHIYMIIITIQAIEEGQEHLKNMLENEEWELVDRNWCIGLKDKNNKEIYEGDILGINGEAIGIVKWDNFLSRFIVTNEEDIEDLRPDSIREYNWKVIGNIYENKELLKEV